MSYLPCISASHAVHQWGVVERHYGVWEEETVMARQALQPMADRPTRQNNLHSVSLNHKIHTVTGSSFMVTITSYNTNAASIFKNW